MGFRRIAAVAAVIVFLLSLLTTAGFAQADETVPASDFLREETDGAQEGEPEASAPTEVPDETPDPDVPAEVGGETQPINGVYFRGSDNSIAVISAFDDDETPEPIYLGGGYAYRLEDGMEVPAANVTYKWFNADSLGRPTGSCISTEEFLFNDGIHDYNPHRPGTCYYLEEVYADGVLVGTDFYTLVIVDTLRFELTAPTDTVSDGPVTITADLPWDWGFQLECLKDEVPELSTATSILEGGQSYWETGTLNAEEGLSEDGKPTVTIQPFSSSQEYLEIHYVLEYQFEDVDHYGAIRIYSRSFKLKPMDPALTPGGESAGSFQAAPMSEKQLRELYRQLILPYHDPQATDDPFALKAAETDEDGALTKASQNQMLSLVNFIRRCAGVNPLTEISERKQEQAQAGAAFLNEHGVLSHNAAEGIDPVANDGLMRSNLSSGLLKSGAPYNIVTLQLNQFKENQAAIMPKMEHRRLLLDNRLQTTAFGYAAPTDANKKTYLVTHVDGSELKTISRSSLEAYPGVGAFPVELMGMKGWSLTVGNGWQIPDPGAVSVTVTKDDGTEIALAQLEDPAAAYDTPGDWFCVNTADVGSGPVIVFSPGSLYEDGDTTKTAGLAGQKVRIRIGGVTEADGTSPASIEYSIEFVSLKDEVGDSVPSPEDPGTTPPDEPDPGIQEPAYPKLPGHGPLKDDLSDLQLTEWNDGYYVTGITASVKAWKADAVLEGAAAYLLTDESDTIRLLSSTEEPSALQDDDPVVTGTILEIRDAAGTLKCEAPIVVYGDLSSSGRINIVQLTELARQVAGAKQLPDISLLAADLNGSGSIDIGDLTILAKRLAAAS